MMKKVVYIFLLITFFGNIKAQTNAKLINAELKNALTLFENEDYLNAYNEYKRILGYDKKNETASLNALICKFKQGHPVDSVMDFLEVVQNSKIPEAMFYMGKVSHQLKNFDNAINYYNKYKAIDERKRKISNDETNRMIDICLNAKKAIANPHRSLISNLGDAINSPYPDYVPLITVDETVLYFTSRREGSSNNKKDVYGNYHEDVYISRFKDGKWQTPENLGPPINSDTHDACVALNPDGQHMIVYRTAPDLITGDLYVTALQADGNWGPLQKYGKEINSQFIETSACFSTDTSEIYFSSNRPGGFGGKDIYRTKKLPNGKWSLPYNLGAAVNTSANEDDPFLHPDGVTLYFSSDGHNTMGEYDVFKTVLNTETNEFTIPENLGYPINSVNNDRFFVLSGDGKHGYYSSVKEDTRGLSDIYMIDTRFGDNDMLIKHAFIYKDGEPGKAKITLLDNENKKISGIYNSNSRTGKFILLMNPLKSYRAIVEDDGFNTVVIEIDPMAFEKEPSELIIKMTKK